MTFIARIFVNQCKKKKSKKWPNLKKKIYLNLFDFIILKKKTNSKFEKTLLWGRATVPL